MAESHPAQGRFPTLALWPLAVAGVVAGVFWWFVLQETAQMRAAYLAAGERDAAHMARAFGEHARRTFTAIESTLRSIEREASRNDGASALNWALEHQRVFTDIGGAAGIFGSDSVPIASTRNADQAVPASTFLELVAAASAHKMVIGAPYVDPGDGEWSIPFGLPVRDPDDRLSRLIVVTARAAYFESFYSLKDFGPTGAVTVLGLNGMVYARSGDQTMTKGKQYPNLKAIAYSADAAVGTYRGPGSLDPDSRILSWRRLSDYPVLVLVTLAEDDVLAQFTRHRSAAYTQGTVISALALVLAAFASFFLGRAQMARHETAQSAQRLRDAVEGLPDGFVLFDANDRMALWNERYLNLLPYVRDLAPLYGRTYAEISRAGLAAGFFADPLAKNDPERWLAQRLHDHRNPPAEPTELLLSSGRWILLRERRTADGGVVGVRTDVTELKCQEIALRSNQERLQGTVVQLEVARRQLEQQADALTQLAEQNLAAKQIAEQAQRAADEARKAAERASRAKSRFLANMSHELRTPLNAIIGFSEIMKSELLGPMVSARYRDYVRDIHASGKHLLALISDILDMSKIEAEKFTLHPGPVNVVELATECSRMLQVRAVKAKLALVVDVDGDLNIVADERAITQMVLNLLSNAIKFTPADGLVTLRARPEGEGIILQVIDTGIGIKPENLPALGGRFEQVDNVYTRTLEGSGLGLAISRGLAQLHGGSLQIESAVGKGTTVTIRLPRQHKSSAVSAA